MNKYKTFTVVLLLLSNLLYSQKDDYSFADFKCGDIKDEFVIPSGIDSEFFFTLNDSTWISFPSKTKLYVSKYILEDELISDFNHVYQTNEGTYFVHSGGGVVLFYDGIDLKRVDDSFYHQNQYGGKSFVYKNEPYLFGGQGLFTAKNILTRYDKQLREWMSVVQSGKIPEFNRNSLTAVVGDELYLLTHQSLPEDDQIKPLLVYRLELNTMTWSLIGQASQKLTSDMGFEFKKMFVDPIEDKLIMSTKNGTFLIDFKNNFYQGMTLDYPLERSAIFNFQNNQNFIGFYCDNKSQLQNIIVSRDEFYNKADKPKELYVVNLDLYYSVLIQILGIIIISIIMVVLIREIKLDRRIVIRLRNSSFIYGLRRLKCFNRNEVGFFIHIAEHDSITFRELEDLLSQSKDSAVTRTKTRERFFRLLNAKLKAVFNIDSNENIDLIFIHSNEEDKRSKYYKLNLEYFKFM